MTEEHFSVDLSRESEWIDRSVVPIYANVGRMGEREGVVHVDLSLNPIPAIRWHFEFVGEQAFLPQNRNFEGSITGYELVVENAIGSVRAVSTRATGTRSIKYKGYAPRVWIGDPEVPLDAVDFYLPNAAAFRRSSEGTLFSDEYRVLHRQGEEVDLKSLAPVRSAVGDAWEAEIEDNTRVFLHLTRDFMDRSQTVPDQGTRLVLSGTLHSGAGGEAGKGVQTLRQAIAKLESLCSMLAFANGGYIGPVIVVGTHVSDHEFATNAVVSAYRTTPLELIGHTWVASETNLCDFMSCLPTFERMVASETWASTYELVLLWYLQAIQPEYARAGGKPWPVVANALGAALERLSATVLKYEFRQTTGKGLKNKITNLLRRIGTYSEDDEVWATFFERVRNDATHPRPEGCSDDEIRTSLNYALLWVEETLLWRLGYDGKYLRRIPGGEFFAFQEPRYDLGTRKESW